MLRLIPAPALPNTKIIATKIFTHSINIPAGVIEDYSFNILHIGDLFRYISVNKN